MNAHSFPKPTARDLLSRIIADIAALNAMGDLADAPTDLLNAIDDGDAAARKLLEWLASRERPCMSRQSWTGENSYPGAM
jgi:hypothetical protein